MHDETIVDTTKIGKRAKNKSKKLNLNFTVIYGNSDDFGKSYNIHKKTVTIGREEVNDIVLHDKKISKTHCKIELSSSKDSIQIFIKDLDSTNGTYINGEYVKHGILRSGDRIELGDTVFRFNFNDEIEEKYHAKLFSIATTDSLTKMFNKGYIHNELKNQVKLASRYKRTFSLILFDIDDFKHINDNHGHLAGDQYLKMAAYIINNTLREQDIPGRFGGEEFLIILPETKMDGAYNLASRIRKRIEQTSLKYNGETLQTTISGGIVQYDASSHDIEQLLNKCDKALYKAKQTGKNKIIKTR